MTQEETHHKMTKRLDEMTISFEDEIIDPIVIMCTHGKKPPPRIAAFYHPAPG